MSGHNNNLWKEIKQNIFLSQKKENDCEMCRLFKLKNDYHIFYTSLFVANLRHMQQRMSNFFHPKFKGKIKLYIYIYIFYFFFQIYFSMDFYFILSHFSINSISFLNGNKHPNREKLFDFWKGNIKIKLKCKVHLSSLGSFWFAP